MRRLLTAPLLVAALVGAPATARAATYTVTDTADSGLGSLRQAITSANGTQAADTIAFDFGATHGAQTIHLASQLPAITSPLTISDIGGGANGAPLNVLSCTDSTYDGLLVGAGSSLTFSGLGVAGCKNDIEVAGGASLTLTGAWLGFDLNGAVVAGSGTGTANAILAAAGSILTVGGPDASDGNFISGATTGINAAAPATTLIRNNRIGTSLDGASWAGDATGIAIGGSATTLQDNLVVGGSTGIALSGTNAVVQRNQLCLGAAGTGAVTGLPAGASGITTTSASSGLEIGGDQAGDGNVVAGCPEAGITVAGAGTKVEGNYLGLARDGATAVGNGSGIAVLGTASGSEIGGDGSAGNVIAASTGDGVDLLGASTGVVVSGNLIGTTADGTAPRPAGGFGVLLDTAGAAQGPIDARIDGNRIVTAGQPGIAIKPATSTGNQLLGNLISGGSQPIDLFPAGATPNDPGDADAGPNGLQNFPVIGAVAVNSVTSTIDTTPHTAVRVQAFAANADGSSTLAALGESTATTDDNGHAVVAIPITVVPGTPVVETATTADGTSEVSAPLAAAAPSGTDPSDSLLPIVRPNKQANVGLQPIVSAPVKIPIYALSVGKMITDGKHILFTVSTTGASAVTVQVGGTDQPATKKQKFGIPFRIISHTVRPGASTSFALTIPAPRRVLLRREIKHHKTITYTPTIIVRNAATTGQRSYTAAIKILR